jgi:EAL and modified HD-GYP domain-containing signal transduction protein
MRQQGYTLALDDFVLRKNERNPFTELVDIIKVDFMGTRPEDRKTIAEQYGRNAGIKLLAEKTETRKDFQEAMDLGFSLFQGFFFSKPVLISKRDIPGYKLTCLQVLKELNREELDFEALQKVIKRDPCLTYMLLKYLNSPFLGLRCQISSIKQALIILGDMEIKKWCSLSVLNQMGKEHPVELLRMALLRASFCESLALKVGLEGKKSELFLMGLFSFMDVILGRPLPEILEDVPLQKELKEALLGRSNAYRKIFDLVVAYERGQWPEVFLLAKDLKLQEEELPEAYAYSLDWLSKNPLAV